MRIALGFVFVVACSGGMGGDLDDLEENQQGVCSNLEAGACRTNPQCQLAYVDSGFQPQPFFMHCLALDDLATIGLGCEALEREACRARRECSPVFFQELGPNDGPVGDPFYERCALEADLAMPAQ